MDTDDPIGVSFHYMLVGAAVKFELCEQTYFYRFTIDFGFSSRNEKRLEVKRM